MKSNRGREHSALVICISPGLKGRWDVSEKGFVEEPLASFDEKEDAYAYAIELTRSREGATVLVEDKDGFTPLSTHGVNGTARDGVR